MRRIPPKRSTLLHRRRINSTSKRRWHGDGLKWMQRPVCCGWCFVKLQPSGQALTCGRKKRKLVRHEAKLLLMRIHFVRRSKAHAARLTFVNGEVGKGRVEIGLNGLHD